MFLQKNQNLFFRHFERNRADDFSAWLQSNRPSSATKAFFKLNHKRIAFVLKKKLFAGDHTLILAKKNLDVDGEGKNSTSRLVGLDSKLHSRLSFC